MGLILIILLILLLCGGFGYWNSTPAGPGYGPYVG